MTDSDEVFEVESLIDYRQKDGKDHFQVQWKGFKETTWEPDENIPEDLKHMKDAIKQRTLVGPPQDGKAAKRKNKETAGKKKKKKEVAETRKRRKNKSRSSSSRSSSSSETSSRTKRKKKKKEEKAVAAMMQQQMMHQWQYAQAVQQQQWQAHQQWQAQQQAQHQQQQEAAAQAAQHAAALQAAQEAQQKLLAQHKQDRQHMDAVKRTVDSVNQRLAEPAIIPPRPPASVNGAGLAKQGGAPELVPPLMKVQIQSPPPNLAMAKAVPPIMSSKSAAQIHAPTVIPPRHPAKSGAALGTVPAIVRPPIGAGGVPAPRLITPIHGPDAPKAFFFHKAAPP